MSNEFEVFLIYLWLCSAIVFDIIGIYSFIKIWQNTDDFVVKSRYVSVLCLQIIAMIFIVTLALIDPYISKYHPNLLQVLCYKRNITFLFFPFIAIPYICRIFRIIRVYRYTENKERATSMKKLSRGVTLSHRETFMGGLCSFKRRRIINLTNERNVLLIIFTVFALILTAQEVAQIYIQGNGCFFFNNFRGYTLPIEYGICIILYLAFLMDLYKIEDLYGVAKELKIIGWHIIVTCILMEIVIFYAILTGYSPASEGYYTFLVVPATIMFSMIGPLLVSYIWMHWHLFLKQNSAEASTRSSQVDTWTIERILNTNMVLDAFEEAAKKRLCSENLDFLIEVKKFQAMQNKNVPLEDCHSRILEIIETFIDEHATNQVNISASARKSVMQYKNIEQVKSIYGPEDNAIFEIFDLPYSEVSSMLSRNLLKPFLLSDTFKRLSMLYNFGDRRASSKPRPSFLAGSNFVKGMNDLRRSFLNMEVMNNDSETTNSQVEMPNLVDGPHLSESLDAKNFENPALKTEL